ncbi:MAG: gamma-glutamyl-gamma-aminobutyrate hydrolase family protein [Anaerolineae bacterium]
MPESIIHPLIGIPSQSDIAQDERELRFCGYASYVKAIEGAGGAPVHIPLMMGKTTLRAVYRRLDGLLLAGGKDVDPGFYGEAVHEKCGQVDRQRDETELMLTRWALADGLPILAICRGIQVLNVAMGGTLYQDIEAQMEGALKHTYYPGYPFNLISHEVIVRPDSRLAAALENTKLGVNSLHHQAIKKVASGLRVVARAEDGLVEGVEGEGEAFVLGVQWHPEELVDDDRRMRDLFRAFVEAK